MNTPCSDSAAQCPASASSYGLRGLRTGSRSPADVEVWGHNWPATSRGSVYPPTPFDTHPAARRDTRLTFNFNGGTGMGAISRSSRPSSAAGEPDDPVQSYERLD
ncbi:hypothetical protein GCM10020221_21230 [Streptomyces thioluteus]|uniref:Uncharacterized protein n=1 Tax=Streptomyces thioluteus TaxID=66431 RepID=A0ABN3WQZ2_STRTU